MKLNLIKRVLLELFIPALTIIQVQTEPTKHIAAKPVVNSKLDGTNINSKVEETLSNSVLHFMYAGLSPLNPSTSFTDGHLILTNIAAITPTINAVCPASVTSTTRVPFLLNALANSPRKASVGST